MSWPEWFASEYGARSVVWLSLFASAIVGPIVWFVVTTIRERRP